MKSAAILALSAVELRDEIARGAITSVEVARAYLTRIAEAEPGIGAWASLDAEHVLHQAEAADRLRKSGRPTGPLHGVPVGIKDIIDTADLPTENGTEIDRGRRPQKDAAIVSRLRAAGAVILGKTVTTELAVYTPGATRNPHDPDRTPGGSSSGSAAAVAAGMVPLAVGTQTNGSVIRPASFCGIVGFKPSRGLVSRSGVLTQSPSLDQIGGFGRTVEDVALLLDAMAGYDPDDKAMRPMAAPMLQSASLSTPPLRPSLGLVRSPVWDQSDDDTREGFAELGAALGDAIEDVDLPGPFDRVHAMHRTVMLTEIARSFARYQQGGRDRLSDTLNGMIDEGRSYAAVDYAAALDWMDILNSVLDRLFDKYDAFVTPAAIGEAPLGLETTGNPVFCTIWTFCGLPAITLPLLVGRNGLPIGVQIVGRRGFDGRLLRTAQWLLNTIYAEAPSAEAVQAPVLPPDLSLEPEDEREPAPAEAEREVQVVAAAFAAERDEVVADEAPDDADAGGPDSADETEPEETGPDEVGPDGTGPDEPDADDGAELEEQDREGPR